MSKKQKKSFCIWKAWSSAYAHHHWDLTIKTHPNTNMGLSFFFLLYFFKSREVILYLLSIRCTVSHDLSLCCEAFYSIAGYTMRQHVDGAQQDSVSCHNVGLVFFFSSCRCVEQMVTSSDDYLICLSQFFFFFGSRREGFHSKNYMLQHSAQKWHILKICKEWALFSTNAGLWFIDTVFFFCFFGNSGICIHL